MNTFHRNLYEIHTMGYMLVNRPCFQDNFHLVYVYAFFSLDHHDPHLYAQTQLFYNPSLGPLQGMKLLAQYMQANHPNRGSLQVAANHKHPIGR